MTKRKLWMVIYGLFLMLSAGCHVPGNADADFAGRWPDQPDRIWVGEEYWANRLHDWRISNGRIECVVDRMFPMRTLHLLTARLGAKHGGFEMHVRTGSVDDMTGTDESACGFLVGVGRGAIDYRAAALVQAWPGKGAGLFAGVSGAGQLFIRDNELHDTPALAEGKQRLDGVDDVKLRLKALPCGNDAYELKLEALDPASGSSIDSVACTVSSDRLVGNVALVSHPGRSGKKKTEPPINYWFDDWKLWGDKVEMHEESRCGPILCTQYTLSEGVMKMTAQLMPVGDTEPRNVQLEINQNGKWKSCAEANIVKPGWTATFKVADWPNTIDVPYRVTWKGRSWSGVVRKDPTEKASIVVAGFTGNHNNSHSIGGWNKQDPNRNNWIDGMWFPHTAITGSVAKHDPDVLFFSGDQVYEGKSPTFADTKHIKLDYLYKWYLWCWAYRDLTKDRPTITIPDDHDVYQGNLWGQGGRKSPGRDHHGGYVHPADFVRMVERTQTSHLPDPYDPAPLEQGIRSYYTSMVYGKIGFAVLEDRKFKSGCAREDMPESGTKRPDHFNDPGLDVKTLDKPGLKLLGDRQLEFLKSFVQDWKGHEMKIALSQTIFANMATHHGGGLTRLRCDLDSNGWPQSGRNRAIDALRRGFIFHLAGDQHLATLVHHGIDDFEDAGWSMCVPSVANFYPRAWAPRCDMPYEYPPPDDYLGSFHDGFGHPVVVHAATNPGMDMGQANKDLHDKMPGYGIVRMNKEERRYTIECWPRSADPDKDAQYEGWPKTIHQMANYGREPTARLHPITIVGTKEPVVQIVDERTGEPEYTLRMQYNGFEPYVFGEGPYTLRILDPENDRCHEENGLIPIPLTPGAPTEKIIRRIEF